MSEERHDTAVRWLVIQTVDRVFALHFKQFFFLSKLPRNASWNMMHKRWIYGWMNQRRGQGMEVHEGARASTLHFGIPSAILFRKTKANRLVLNLPLTSFRSLIASQSAQNLYGRWFSAAAFPISLVLSCSNAHNAACICIETQSVSGPFSGYSIVFPFLALVVVICRSKNFEIIMHETATNWPRFTDDLFISLFAEQKQPTRRWRQRPRQP